MCSELKSEFGGKLTVDEARGLELDPLTWTVSAERPLS